MTSTSTVSPERSPQERRAFLRKALVLRKEDTRILPALKSLLRPEFVREASKSGVFIAYSRCDEVFAFELHTQLKEAGVAVWMDSIDILLEEDWQEAELRALARCGVMLLIVSPHALESAELRQQISQYMQAGKIVLPILHELSPLDVLKLDSDPIDFRRDNAMALQQLLSYLQTKERV